MTGYLLLTTAAIIGSRSLIGLMSLIDRCNEARSHKLGAGCAPSSYGDTGATAMAGAEDPLRAGV